MFNRVLLFVGGVLLASASTASAQYWGYSYRPATYEESVARGYADVVRSAGQYNLQTSEAAKNLTDARSQDLDNRLKATEYYFESRRINREARKAERGPRPTSQQLFKIAADTAPDRLSPNQVDPLTGQINWPLLLRQQSFAPQLQELEQAYKSRAEGSMTYDDIRTVTATVDELLAELQEDVKEYPPNDYIQAKNFLRSIAREVRFPPGS